MCVENSPPSTLSTENEKFLDNLLISSDKAYKEKREYFQSGQWLNDVSLKIQNNLNEQAKLLNDPSLYLTYYIG